MIFDQERWVYMSSMDMGTWPTETGIQPASETRWQTRTTALTSRCGRGERSGSPWLQPINVVMIPIQRYRSRCHHPSAALFPRSNSRCLESSQISLAIQPALGQKGRPKVLKSLLLDVRMGLYELVSWREPSKHLRNPTMPYNAYI